MPPWFISTFLYFWPLQEEAPSSDKHQFAWARAIVHPALRLPSPHCCYPHPDKDKLQNVRPLARQKESASMALPTRNQLRSKIRAQPPPFQRSFLFSGCTRFMSTEISVYFHFMFSAPSRAVSIEFISMCTAQTETHRCMDSAKSMCCHWLWLELTILPMHQRQKSVLLLLDRPRSAKRPGRSRASASSAGVMG